MAKYATDKLVPICAGCPVRDICKTTNSVVSLYDYIKEDVGELPSHILLKDFVIQCMYRDKYIKLGDNTNG